MDLWLDFKQEKEVVKREQNFSICISALVFTKEETLMRALTKTRMEIGQRLG